MNRNELLDELSWFTKPIFEAVSDDKELSFFFRQFGYELDPLISEDILSTFRTLANEITPLLGVMHDDETNSNLSLEDLVSIINGITALAENDTIKNNFTSGFFEEIFDYLLINYLSIRRPVLFSILYTLGIIEYKEIDSSLRDHSYFQIKFHWSRFSDFILDNPKWAKEVFGWKGNPNTGDEKEFDYEHIFNSLKLILESTGLALVFPYKLTESETAGFLTNIPQEKEFYGAAFPLLQDDVENIDEEGTPLFSKEAGFKILPYGDFNEPQNLGFAIAPYAKGDVTGVQELSENLKLSIDISSQAQGGGYITLTPKGISNQTGGNISEKFKLEIKYANETEDATIPLITYGETSKLEADAMRIAFGGDIKGNFYLSAGLEKLQATIDLRNDDFLSNIYDHPVNINAGDILVKWQYNKGISFEGGNNVAIVVPVHIEIGPLKITAVGIGLELKNKSSGVFYFDCNLNLGPLLVSVNAIGITAEIKKDNDGNLGKYDFALGFKSPNGISLSIDTGGIKGGGGLTLDPEKGEYFGSIELEFKAMFSMKAYGIINTKLPDGSPGFSLLIVITAEFTPIQLGFGFTLNGVGGLLAVNRTTRIDVLKEGIKTNSFESILFPEDAMANISRILSDIKQVFPTQPRHFLIAPMAKIAWGTPTIITMEMGLLIEIPSSRLVILGVLKALLPKEEKPLLKLQVNFIGEIDFENKTISFDAILYNSTLLTFTLAGQMALRIAWGDKPVFVLSVGGFHPAYKEIPKGLEQMRRITIGLINTSDVRLTIQNYFAVTSNTVQFGAKAELLAAHGSWNIYGFIGYDVLFQFDPFKFIADFSAGVALRRHESVVMGIRVSGTLAGPSPWDAKGSASVSFFFFSISVPFHKSWGDNAAVDVTEKIDLIQMLTELIDDNRSWSAAIPSYKNLHVSIKSIPINEEILAIHPFGVLTFSERLVPLGIDIDKIGTKLPKNVNHFVISPPGSDFEWEPVSEQFAPANFIRMTDDEKLKSPSFESLQSGFKITGSESLFSPMVINKKVDYEFSYLGREKTGAKVKYQFEKNVFKKKTIGGIISKSPLSYTGKRVSVNAPERVVVEEERFVVANVSNMQLHNEAAAAGSYIEAVQYCQHLVNNDPSLKDKLQVLSAFELKLN